jgi:hypothetical protein
MHPQRVLFFSNADMQFTNWTDCLHETGLVFGNKLESQRAGNHTAIYYPLRRNSKPVRFYTPLLKCKFAPSEEYNTLDASVYAPASGTQSGIDDFVDRIRHLEENIILWCVANADTVFCDFDPVPNEQDIRDRFRSCVIERIESIKFRLTPETGCAYFDSIGQPISKETAREVFGASNLPNIRCGAEIKSVGIYNPTKRRGAKVPFEGKVELRLFAIQVRVIPADLGDSIALSNDVCMMPDETEIC